MCQRPMLRQRPVSRPTGRGLYPVRRPLLGLCLSLLILLDLAAGAAPAAAEQRVCDMRGSRAYKKESPDVDRPAIVGEEFCVDSLHIFYSHNGRVTVWAVQHLTAQSVAAARALPRPDPAPLHIETGWIYQNVLRSFPKDYDGQTWTRGLFVPPADAITRFSLDQSYSYANVIPLHPGLAAKVWPAVEATVRALAEKHGEVYVVTVAVFAGKDTRWITNAKGEKRIAVPSRMAKAVYIPATDQAGAYLADNDADPALRVISLDDLHALAKLDAIPALPPERKAAKGDLPLPGRP